MTKAPDRLADENVRLRRRVAELEAVLRETQTIIGRALPPKRGRYDDPDDVARRLREEPRQPPRRGKAQT